MRIKYGLTIDDLVAWSQFQARGSKTIRRLQLRAIVLIGIILLVASALVSHVAGTWVPFAFGSTVFVLFTAIYPRLYQSALTRNTTQLYGESRNRGLLGPHTMELQDDGVLDRTEYGERKTYWKGIERIEVTERYVFIYLSSISAQVVPRFSITEGDFDDFVAELRRRWPGPTV